MRVDLYARKSTADAGRSVARQERAWRADCASEGLAAGEVFVDPDLSASRYARKARPDFARLVEHIRSGQCQAVALWEASRGSRTLSEYVTFLDLCRDSGVLIRIFGEGGRTFDPRKRADYKALATEGVAAHDESERLSGRIIAGNRDAASLGRPPGPTLYGFRREHGPPVEDDTSASGARRREIRQLVNEAEAAIIRRLAQDTLDGVPLQAQADRLNAEGVATQSGRGKWSGGNINRLLRNPALVGDRVYKGEVVARDAWPAILTREQFRALTAMLTAPGRRPYVGGPVLKHMLSGAMTCGVCDHRIRTLGSRGRYACVNCYRASASIRLADATVSEVIRARLRKIDAQAVFAPTTDDAAVEKVRRELEGVQDQLRETYALAKARKLSAAGLAAAEAGLLPEVQRLEARLRELSRPPALASLAGIDVAENWFDLEVATRRAVVLALVDLRLSPGGPGVRWSLDRLGESRWVGGEQTWSELMGTVH